VKFLLQFLPRFALRLALLGSFVPFLQALALVLGPVRALARLVAVSRIAAPGANPEPRFREIILLSAAPTDAASEALVASIFFPCVSRRISCRDNVEAKIIVRIELKP